MNRLGAVVIGRNEGEKVRRCLASVLGKADPVVYVDSGSVDGSVDLARALGVEVVELDPSTPFTIARARNEGFARLLEVDPEVEIVQFVDGDSEMVESWFSGALQAFAAEAECAIVCGPFRERSPGRSLYARLYSVMNDTRLADPEVSGGIAMMRVKAFRDIGGFVPALVGSEDREISLYLRRAGWRVRRIEAGMAVHETGMETFEQWWRRRVMNGRSLGQEVELSRSLERPVVRCWFSVFIWGLALPALALVAAWPTEGASLVLFLGHPALALRIHRRMRRLGFAHADATLYAVACTAEKFPNALGMVLYYFERIATRLRVRPRPGARDALCSEDSRVAVPTHRLDPDQRS